MKAIWTPLEHKIKAQLDETEIATKLRGKTLAMAFSGGMDSALVLHWLIRSSRTFGFKVKALHFHHGQGSNSHFRDEALAFVQGFCQRQSLALFFKKHEGSVLHSEQEMRGARWNFFHELRSRGEFDWVVTGHHSADLLETRLLRLIRGCGPQGLTGMTLLDGQVFRPFLSASREECLEYFNAVGAEFIEDPSNQNKDFLRNWVRHEWLPILERRSPGAVESLARSLQSLVDTVDQQEIPNEIWMDGDRTKGLFRPVYHASTREQQKRYLAAYLLFLGVKDFRHTQIEEIRKYLDTAQIIHTFKIAHLQWQVNAEQIRALN